MHWFSEESPLSNPCEIPDSSSLGHCSLLQSLTQREDPDYSAILTSQIKTGKSFFPEDTEDEMPLDLHFRELELGKDYWVEDNVLPNPVEIAQRCIANSTWTLGSPWRPEAWPGMRAPNALTKEELQQVEECVKKGLGLEVLMPQSTKEMEISGHNHIQICGGEEGVARPHVDSASICDYAAVLYLHPSPPTSHCGTSLYRLHLPGEDPGGNVCPRQYESLSQVPNLPKQMDPTMFEEILEVPYVFNRLLAYKSDIIHSASSYFGWGHKLASKRMAVVFFWKAGNTN